MSWEGEGGGRNSLARQRHMVVTNHSWQVTGFREHCLTWVLSSGPSHLLRVSPIDILSVDGAFAAVMRDIWPPSWSCDRELESSKNW